MKKINLTDGALPEYDMVVFCHLRWDFVYQRPQHLITRMSENYRVLVVEEPVPHGGEFGTAEILEVHPKIHVFRPHVNSIEEAVPVLKNYIGNQQRTVGWFYSASFVPMLEEFNFDTVVYDCMDELSLFKHAPAKLVEQENQLIKRADVVYTGGKSLYEAKKQRHGNVHCFPSSVDVAHFANEAKVPTVPKDICALPHPVVGYYGVIDERIDLDLIRDTAAKMPNASFVMIGPVCKIDENDLPKADNIYYLGMKSYDELPQYLKCFDIAMMPFALNDSTKYISPTKTLEYMSARKPIISTKIKDVVRDYSNCIRLIETSEEFVKAIKQEDAKKEYLGHYEEILEKTSWDTTATKMTSLLQNVKVTA